MKRVEIERQAIIKALRDAPNITSASQALGSSRRTLQSRMRDYSIPPGQAGRPRQLLPYSGGDFDVTNLFPWLAGASVLGLIGLVVYLARRKESTVEVTGSRMVGLDLLGVTR